MFYEEIRTKQDFSHISVCSLSILYSSKFILISMSLGTNAVIVMRVHCINSVVPSQTQKNVASDQGLHCLQLIQQCFDKLTDSKLDLFRI